MLVTSHELSFVIVEAFIFSSLGTAWRDEVGAVRPGTVGLGLGGFINVFVFLIRIESYGSARVCGGKACGLGGRCSLVK